MMENIDRHVLAGFYCVDAITGSSIFDSLSVNGAPLRLRRNRSGIFAVMDAQGIDRSKTQVLIPDPSSWPKATGYEITIQDLSFRYLARRANIQVPQPLPTSVNRGVPVAPPPTTTTAQGATPPLPPVNVPQIVVLYPAPSAPVAPNWAVIRASVMSSATPAKPLAGAVVQASAPKLFTATGVTNSNGETLLAVPGLGLQLSTNGSGAVTETTIAATVNAWFDSTLLGKPATWISNPDDTLNNLSKMKPATSQSVQLAPSQTVFVTLTISL